MATPARIHRPPAGRVRRRWRFHPRGIIGALLAIVIAINLYVLADNIVRLTRLRRKEAADARRLEQIQGWINALRQQRDWMRGDDFLREQAHDLGYIAPGESAQALAEEADPDSYEVKKRKSAPSPPY